MSIEAYLAIGIGVIWFGLIIGTLLWKLIDQSRWPKGTRAHYRDKWRPEVGNPGPTMFDPDTW